MWQEQAILWQNKPVVLSFKREKDAEWRPYQLHIARACKFGPGVAIALASGRTNPDPDEYGKGGWKGYEDYGRGAWKGQGRPRGGGGGGYGGYGPGKGGGGGGGGDDFAAEGPAHDQGFPTKGNTPKNAPPDNDDPWQTGGGA